MASAGTKDMTHGVPWRLISVFAVPIFSASSFSSSITPPTR